MKTLALATALTIAATTASANDLEDNFIHCEYVGVSSFTPVPEGVSIRVEFWFYDTTRRATMSYRGPMEPMFIDFWGAIQNAPGAVVDCQIIRDILEIGAPV